MTDNDMKTILKEQMGIDLDALMNQGMTGAKQIEWIMQAFREMNDMFKVIYKLLVERH